ncbi:hypothetical protein GGR50DRAFT_34004 [Xylaria sp. CBS 124048]|nr:hypothetical protein GGR50DRAFT_34004 [Xylaria sp. CBS 124048]
MSDYSMYHALGQGEDLDPNDPRRTTQPAPPQFEPPIASQQYEQGHSQQYHGSPQAPVGFEAGADLASQMAGMSLDGQQTVRKKKRDRHAFHNVEAPAGSSQAYNGIPPPGTAATAFLNADSTAMAGGKFGQPNSPNQLPMPGAPYGASPNQFPATVNAPYNPITPATTAEFAARASRHSQPAAQVSATGGGIVSPDEIPSVPLSRDVPQQYYLDNVFPTFERHVPPPATISFVAFDQGNSSPKFARLSMNSIPATVDALQSTALPLGMILQPLAALQPGELEVPVLDFGDQGPPRCRRCRAYINPFMMFRSGGSKFVCNLCSYPNDTPSEYFCATTPHGVRVDRDQRPELTRGTVEFTVPKEYWTREPTGLNWLFVIDVTQEAFNKGFLEAFCEGILAALYAPEGVEDTENDAESRRQIPLGAKVGFVTYDKDVHFYNCNPALEQAQMMIMPDIEDPFVPLSDGLFVDPYESKAIITSLLTRLPALFASIKNPEPALLPALSASLAALEKTGGKMVCSLSALPTWGPGRLFLRDDGKYPGGEVDKKLYTTEHPGWRKIAEKMVAAGVGIDFFLAAPSGGYLDVATIGHVSSTTGGEVFYYPNFVGGRDNTKLSQEIKHTVTRETGYQALMKVRCSNGLQISSYHGNFMQHTFGADLEIGVIDSDKAIGVMFGHDGKLDIKLDAHFQSALLYTTASGQRRVRCCNVIASITDQLIQIMKFIDQDAMYSLIAKEAASKVSTTSSTLKDVRQSITEKTIDILSCYRKNFTTQPHPPGQLVMPEKLKELAMYMLAIMKTRALKGGHETSDRRVHELRMIKTMGVTELSLYLYPRMIPIHNLDPEDGFPDEKTGHLRLPPSSRASFSRVEPGGVYLIDNGQQCLLWFDVQTSPNLLVDLFGEGKDSLSSLDPYTASLPVLQTHLNAQVRNLIEFFRTLRGSKSMAIQIARRGTDGAEYEFARMLVEDRNNEAQSYVDWLVHLHKGIQLELAGQRQKTSDEGSSSLASTFSGLRPAYW